MQVDWAFAVLSIQVVMVSHGFFLSVEQTKDLQPTLQPVVQESVQQVRHVLTENKCLGNSA